jgi:murein L,D-transpeptidase YcbB/YkuD
MTPGVAFARAAAAEVQAAIRAEAGGDVGGFYRARQHRPLWIRGGTIGAEADRLLRLLESADADGLDPDDYRPGALATAIRRARGGDAEDLAEAELLLSRRFAQYVRDVRRPRDGVMIYADRQLRPARPTVRAVLDAAAAAPSLQGYLDAVGWMHPIYGQLRSALAAGASGAQMPQLLVPPGPTLRLGSRGERVRLLRQRLGLDPNVTFDAALAEALREFQRAHGLPDDALAGPRTLAALNGAAGAPVHLSGEQERTLRLNLQRARALPAEPPQRYILVDAAAARLYTYEDGRVRDTMRVVVGRATDQTPMIAGLIRYATVNPYWNVPPDLVGDRIARHVVRYGTGYLRERGYEVLSDWTERAVPVDPNRVDWAAVAAGRREIRVRQRPGPHNAMGRMKFMFPNQLGVYLHDTPERDLLREATRQFSAGCVRVEDAPRLAHWLFGHPLRAGSGPPEQQVLMHQPVPVYITYLTAAPEGGRIAFRPDVYGRDGTRMATR